MRLSSSSEEIANASTSRSVSSASAFMRTSGMFRQCLREVQRPHGHWFWFGWLFWANSAQDSISWVLETEGGHFVVIGEGFSVAAPFDHGAKRLFRRFRRHVILKLVEKAALW